MASNSVPLDPDKAEIRAALTEALAEADAPKKPALLAPTEHYVDVSWRDNPLNDSITNRLASIDRCLAATSSIQRLLHRDLVGKQEVADQCDEDEVKYLHHPLRPDEIDGLHLGLAELMQQALESLRSIRDDEYAIATKQSKGQR
ncbi:TPA: hypothetical protein UMF67_001772 [Stenotrophomonas maltophilia]|nr:hypothetical protein [Stenotrophomonas maltophilia]